MRRHTGYPHLETNWLALLSALAIALGALACERDAAASVPESQASAATSTVTPERTSTPAAPAAPAPQDAEAQQRLRPVSKQDPLPDGFVPSDLVLLPRSATAPTAANAMLTRETADALLAMQASAARAGFDIRVVSAYRSYNEQVEVHARLAERVGAAQAARRSAPPGHSEHQLGTTADLSAASVGWGLSIRLAETAEGAWLRDHAHEFGFALSYPADGEALTGYVFEPWHFRYIGREDAAHWHASGLPLLLFLREEASH